jgi:cell cycle checkpoint protein
MKLGRKQLPRRRKATGPLRLDWPAVGACQDLVGTKDLVSFSQEESAFVPVRRKQKRPRKNAVSHTGGDTSSHDNALWIDRYNPQCIADVCVAPKKVQEVRQWIQSAMKDHIHKLLILVGSPGIGKSTMIRCLAKENRWSISEWNETFSNQYSALNSAMHSVDQQSSLSSFQEFLRQAGTGYHSLTFESSSNSSTKQDGSQISGSIILLESLPTQHESTQMRLRELFTEHVRTTSVPTVLIFSDVLEGKHKREDLESLVDPNLLYSDLCLILQIQPCTKQNMKRVLSLIVRAERLSVPSSIYEDLHERSNGDLRSAITTFQYEAMGQSMTVKNTDATNRDRRLSPFHALGKLLYAKRVTGAHKDPLSWWKWKDDRPPIDFNPENVLEHSGIEQFGTLSFLEHHSPDFFSDISELSDTLATFSDSALLMDCSSISGSQNAAASLAGRAVAAFNRHPRANKFRQLSAPKIFEVNRNRRENEVHLRHLHHSLSTNRSNELSLHSALGATSHFVSDSLSFLRRIIPESIDLSLNTMHSRFRLIDKSISSSNDTKTGLLKEQQQVLLDDDIGDFDSE